jgi:hypothetical protein
MHDIKTLNMIMQHEWAVYGNPCLMKAMSCRAMVTNWPVQGI